MFSLEVLLQTPNSASVSGENGKSLALDRVQCVNGRESQHEQTVTEKTTRGCGGGSAVPPPWPDSPVARATGMDDRREPPPVPRPGPGTRGENSTRGSQKNFQNSNDPSAGSPTETLLRLLHFKPP